MRVKEKKMKKVKAKARRTFLMMAFLTLFMNTKMLDLVCETLELFLGKEQRMEMALCLFLSFQIHYFFIFP